MMTTMLRKFNEWLQGQQAPDRRFHDKTVTVGDQVLHLKRMELRDVGVVLEIERAIFGGTPWDRYAFLSELQKRRSSLYLACFDESQENLLGIIGGFFRGDRAHVTILLVDPQYQRRGIGRMLMNEIIGIAKSQGRQRVTLEVAVDNAGAQHLYHALGFKDGQIRHDYYTEEHKDAMDMELSLVELGQEDINE